MSRSTSFKQPRESLTQPPPNLLQNPPSISTGDVKASNPSQRTVGETNKEQSQFEQDRKDAQKLLLSLKGDPEQLSASKTVLSGMVQQKALREFNTGEPAMDWFNFETRIRKVIFDVIEPLTKKQFATFDGLDQMKKQIAVIDGKYEEVLLRVERVLKKNEMVDRLDKYTREIETELYALKALEKNDVTQLLEKVETMNSRWRVTQADVNNFHKYDEKITKVQKMAQDLTEQFKHTVTLRMKEMSSEFMKQVTELEKQNREAKQEMQELMVRVQTVKEFTQSSDVKFANLSSLIENLRDTIENSRLPHSQAAIIRSGSKDELGNGGVQVIQVQQMANPLKDPLHQMQTQIAELRNDILQMDSVIRPPIVLEERDIEKLFFKYYVEMFERVYAQMPGLKKVQDYQDMSYLNYQEWRRQMALKIQQEELEEEAKGEYSPHRKPKPPKGYVPFWKVYALEKNQTNEGLHRRFSISKQSRDSRMGTGMLNSPNIRKSSHQSPAQRRFSIIQNADHISIINEYVLRSQGSKESTQRGQNSHHNISSTQLHLPQSLGWADIQNAHITNSNRSQSKSKQALQVNQLLQDQESAQLNDEHYRNASMLSLFNRTDNQQRNLRPSSTQQMQRQDEEVSQRTQERKMTSMESPLNGETPGGAARKKNELDFDSPVSKFSASHLNKHIQDEHAVGDREELQAFEFEEIKEEEQEDNQLPVLHEESAELRSEIDERGPQEQSLEQEQTNENTLQTLDSQEEGQQETARSVESFDEEDFQAILKKLHVHPSIMTQEKIVELVELSCQFLSDKFTEELKDQQQRLEAKLSQDRIYEQLQDMQDQFSSLFKEFKSIKNNEQYHSLHNLIKSNNSNQANVSKDLQQQIYKLKDFDEQLYHKQIEFEGKLDLELIKMKRDRSDQQLVIDKLGKEMKDLRQEDSRLEEEICTLAGVIGTLFEVETIKIAIDQQEEMDKKAITLDNMPERLPSFNPCYVPLNGQAYSKQHLLHCIRVLLESEWLASTAVSPFNALYRMPDLQGSPLPQSPHKNSKESLKTTLHKHKGSTHSLQEIQKQASASSLPANSLQVFNNQLTSKLTKICYDFQKKLDLINEELERQNRGLPKEILKIKEIVEGTGGRYKQKRNGQGSKRRGAAENKQMGNSKREVLNHSVNVLLDNNHHTNSNLDLIEFSQLGLIDTPTQINLMQREGGGDNSAATHGQQYKSISPKERRQIVLQNNPSNQNINEGGGDNKNQLRSRNLNQQYTYEFNTETQQSPFSGQGKRIYFDMNSQQQLLGTQPLLQQQPSLQMHSQNHNQSHLIHSSLSVEPPLSGLNNPQAQFRSNSQLKKPLASFNQQQAQLNKSFNMTAFEVPKQKLPIKGSILLNKPLQNQAVPKQVQPLNSSQILNSSQVYQQQNYQHPLINNSQNMLGLANGQNNQVMQRRNLNYNQGSRNPMGDLGHSGTSGAVDLSLGPIRQNNNQTLIQSHNQAYMSESSAYQFQMSEESIQVIKKNKGQVVSNLQGTMPNIYQKPNFNSIRNQQ